MPVFRLCLLGLTLPIFGASIFAQANQSQEQGPFKIGGPVSAPQLISKVEPEYSEEARRAGLQGTVVLYVVVDGNGAPRDFKVVRSVGLGLDEKAVEAVQKWRFKPGFKDGKPVSAAAQIEVNFRLVGNPLDQLLTQGYALKPESIPALENSLAKTADDVDLRVQLLAFYTAHPDVTGVEPARDTRARHLFWLIQNIAELNALDNPVSLINRSGEPLASEGLYERGRDLWMKKVESAPGNVLVLAHASRYLEVADRERAEQLIFRMVAKDRKYTGRLGELYGLAAIGTAAINLTSGSALTPSLELLQSNFARRALASIIASTDAALVAGATDIVTRSVRNLRKSGSPFSDILPACQQITDRAGAIKVLHTLDCEGRESPTRIRVGGNVQAANLIGKVTPPYPSEAKRERVSGTVRFQVVIGTDGLIHDVQLIAGPPLLVKAAEDAVRQWQYKPTMLNGKPVEVVTQIDVNFELSVR